MKYLVVFIIAISFFTWRIWELVPGENDPYYLKFTQGQYQGLIIGSSRAGQGIIPSLLNEDIYNFSFNGILSPYGPSYTRAIFKKISDQSHGPFIIEINPTSVALSSTRERADVFSYPEDAGLLANMHFFNSNPNLEYVMKSRRSPFYKKEHSPFTLRLHNDGWLEVVNAPNIQSEKRMEVMIKSYENLFKDNFLSGKRINSLKDLIQQLKRRGKVFLVRIPTSREISQIENKYFPQFDEDIAKIGQELNIPYINLFHEPGFQTIDGDHLTKESAENFTKLLKTKLE